MTQSTLQPLQTNEDNPFAYRTMSERLPQLLKSLQVDNDYSDFICKNLDALHDDMVNDKPLPAQDYLAPDAIFAPDVAGQTWLNTGWFMSEMLFFREVINRVQYWQTGHDPYRVYKHEELYSEGLKSQVQHVLSIEGEAAERIQTMLHLALWGNRADLSLPEVVELGQTVDEDDLLVDDSVVAADALLNRSGDVHIITDNFGTELAMDLMLVYHLLQEGVPVRMHVKMNPTYVSDATAQDVHWMLNTLPEIEVGSVSVVGRLRDALETGQWRIYPDFFWHRGRFYDDLPAHIHMAFSQARVIISKGDANYRRAVQDTVWPVDTAFSEVTAALPAPFLALRTLKSDPVVGLSQGQADTLDKLDANWRTNGKRGVIQYRQ